MPDIPAEVNDTLLRYQNARSAGFSGWTPDGGMLIATRFGETALVSIHVEPWLKGQTPEPV